MSIRMVSPARRRSVTIDLPPSKSYTNRALIAAALAEGESTIRNPSISTDTEFLVSALGRFGIGIIPSGRDLIVRGCGGRIGRADRSVYVGNAGSTARFISSLAAMAPGTTLIEGDREMDARPMTDLIAALEQGGARVNSADGHTPLRITGGEFRGGTISLDAGKSSQFLSSLLLVAPCAPEGMEIVLTAPPGSSTYIGMTLGAMESFGVQVESLKDRYRVSRTRYRPAVYDVEADLSGSTFFASAAAITGATVTIPGVSAHSLQGDLAFFSYMERMGCRVVFDARGVAITGPQALTAIEADLNDAPDSVPPLAVTAAFASGTTGIANVAHLAFKETDRLQALRNELPKIGAVVRPGGNGLVITGGKPRPAVIETYKDHRIAMSFAVAGLKTGNMQIINPGCVVKSFPGFWEELEKFY